MKFAVTRTSEWNDEVKPCEEAFQEEYTRIDIRGVDDPAKIPVYHGNKELANKEWYGEGENHRIENGHIKRDFKDKAFFVEINTLDDLIKFQKKYGELVITTFMWNDSYKEIKIYDDYREQQLHSPGVGG